MEGEFSMEKRKIVASTTWSPFPSHYWCAYYEDEEEKGGYGYGATEEEAIADFKSLQDEDDDDA
jgi:hypothetical protein